MSETLVNERNQLVPMRDGVVLAADVVRPVHGARVPAILNFGPYHKDGRGGRLAVDSVHRHFARLGYACVSADLRGLGNSGGHSPGAFAPGEALDGHDLVEWIAQQPWCDGNVGMWGVSYPGVTALATAATDPPHLKAIVPIHASADLYRGVVALGGTGSGFWMRADWAPRMAAYNLMPPLLPDTSGRSAQVWAEHLQGNAPWLDAFCAHPGFDDFWQSRVLALERITCPTFSICGWRDLYADCTPRDHAAIRAPRKLVMGAWKHEFPDNAREAPAAGLWDMQRWFDRWLKGDRNGIDAEAPVSLYVQGHQGAWRAEPCWPPARQAPLDLYPAGDGSLGALGQIAATTSDYRYDPTVGMYSLAWDPWTTALDPALVRDHSADDARSLCFTGAALPEPLELIGVPEALLDLAASVLPLNVVVKLSAVAPNGRSTLITTGWASLAAHTTANQRARVIVPLRATAYRLQRGERLRVAIACADFPRVWPTPLPAMLRLFHGESRIRLPVCPPPAGDAPTPAWGALQPAALASANDLGGTQTWDITRDLVTDTARLSATKTERVRIDDGTERVRIDDGTERVRIDDGTERVRITDATELVIDHAYGAAVSAAQPEAARMYSTTSVRVVQPAGTTELLARTVTTGATTELEVDIRVDGQPFWHRHWNIDQRQMY